jgi:IS4 transposase
MRRVHLIDAHHGQDLVLLSNIFSSSATQVATYYKQRWQIELFFKWIKQHLPVKAFYGHSSNTVKTQIWTAVCTYLIIKIVQKTNDFNVKLHTMMQVLMVPYCSICRLKSCFLINHSRNIISSLLTNWGSLTFNF